MSCRLASPMCVTPQQQPCAHQLTESTVLNVLPRKLVRSFAVAFSTARFSWCACVGQRRPRVRASQLTIFCCFGVHAEAPLDGALSCGEGLTAQLHAAFASVLKHRDASRLAHPRSLTQLPTANLLLPDLVTLRTVASFIDPHM